MQVYRTHHCSHKIAHKVIGIIYEYILIQIMNIHRNVLIRLGINLNRMFKIGTIAMNENTLSHCDRKFSINAHVKYLRYGRIYRFNKLKNCFSIIINYI